MGITYGVTPVLVGVTDVLYCWELQMYCTVESESAEDEGVTPVLVGVTDEVTPVLVGFTDGVTPALVGVTDIYIYIWIQNCTGVQQNTPKEVHMVLAATL